MAEKTTPEGENASSDATAKPQCKAPYTKPTLTEFGPVASMTGSAGGSITDINNPGMGATIMNNDKDGDGDFGKDKV